MKMKIKKVKSKLFHFNYKNNCQCLHISFHCFYLNQLDCQSFQPADSATIECIRYQRLVRSKNQWPVNNDSRVLHKRYQKRPPSSRAMIILFRAESMCKTDCPLHSIFALNNKKNKPNITIFMIWLIVPTNRNEISLRISL